MDNLFWFAFISTLLTGGFGQIVFNTNQNPKPSGAGSSFVPPRPNTQTRIPQVCLQNRRHPQCKRFFSSGSNPGQIAPPSRPTSSFPERPSVFPGSVSSSNNGHRVPNRCRGNRRNRPECIQFHQNQGSSAPIISSGPISLDSSFSELLWLKELKMEGNSIVLPGLPNTPVSSSGSASTRNYQLAVGANNIPFQRCLTPRRQRGNCRYVQHCILPEFANNFNTFLQYFCIIQGRYVGACCPTSRFPNQATQAPIFPTTASTTTPRPPTRTTDRGCGINSIQQTKIVGGRPAPLNKFPWIAALLRNSATTQYCGGVLISDRHVLTAAHCVDGFDASAIIIRLGEYSFNEQGETQHKDFDVAVIRKHEAYNTTTFVNDLAILTLSRSTAFSDSIWPVCLPPANELFVGETGTVIGWGTIYFGGPVSNVLQEVSIPVWRNSDCDGAYTQKVFPQNLCAGDREGGKDSCQGDSGGPLLIEWGANPRRWTVIGVVSWGIRCAERETPGVYARVNMFLDWIRRNMI